MAPAEQMSHLRRLFASTGAPPQTRLVMYLLFGAAAGAALGVIFLPQKGAVLGALTGALIAAAGSRGPSRIALRVAAFAAVTALVFVFVAFIVAGHPWWAAAAVAAVAIGTSALAGAGPVGAGLAQLGLLIYVLAMVVGSIVHLSDVPLASGVLRIALGAAGGLAVVAVGALLRDRRDREAAAAAPRLPSPWPALWASLRSFDEHARDGVRRAIPLAIGMYLFERSGSHDALWVFMSAFIVLMPTGKSPLDVALARVISTIVGSVVLGLFALALPVSGCTHPRSSSSPWWRSCSGSPSGAPTLWSRAASRPPVPSCSSGRRPGPSAPGSGTACSTQLGLRPRARLDVPALAA